jgi:hypothetical protein
MPAPPTLPDHEAVERLRAKLIDYVELATEAAGDVRDRSRHALELAKFWIRSGHRLKHARAVLASREVAVEDVVREAELASLRHPEILSETSGRSELMRAWTQVLVSAVEKVENDQARARRYASEGATKEEAFVAAHIGDALSPPETSEM